MSMLNDKKVNIKYLGKTGLTKDCVQDFSYLLQFYEKPKRIFVLTVPGSYEEMGVHMLMCLMDNTDPEKNRDFVFIKSGFTSGYEGEGPSGLSKVIEISEEMEIPIVSFFKIFFFSKNRILHCFRG